MGKGIQIKKPDHLGDSKPGIPGLESLPAMPQADLPAIFHWMLILTFPASLVALYFFIQTKV